MATTAGRHSWLRGLLPLAAVERFAQQGPDGVRYLGMGKITGHESPVLQRSAGPVGQILNNFGAPGWDIVADLEGGLKSPSYGHHSFADLLLLVVNPFWESAMTVRRLQNVVATTPWIIVGNGWADEADYPGLKPVVRIPRDPAVIEAEHRSVALIDHAPGAPAVHAIGQLAQLLIDRSTLQPACYS